MKTFIHILNLLVSCLDKDNKILVYRVTKYDDFPITQNEIQYALNGRGDIFISVFDPNLKTLKFSTFLRGSKSESARIKVDDAGNIIGV